jgi:hypothetical protein
VTAPVLAFDIGASSTHHAILSGASLRLPIVILSGASMRAESKDLPDKPVGMEDRSLS